jgi:hypothetical protein
MAPSTPGTTATIVKRLSWVALFLTPSYSVLKEMFKARNGATIVHFFSFQADEFCRNITVEHEITHPRFAKRTQLRKKGL